MKKISIISVLILGVVAWGCSDHKTQRRNYMPDMNPSRAYETYASTANLDSLSATNWLDTVRVHRNLVKYTLPALKRDSLTVEIAKEYHKEFMGEGQVFYYYKRKNLPFSTLPYTKVPVVPNASYVFIKPE